MEFILKNNYIKAFPQWPIEAIFNLILYSLSKDYLLLVYKEKNIIGLSLVKILAKYHIPELMNLFEYSLVTTEMFATSWLLTLFAR